MTRNVTPFDDAFWDTTSTLEEKITDTATHVRNRMSEFGRTAADVESLVKRNPGPALVAVVIIGFLLGRASSRNH